MQKSEPFGMENWINMKPNLEWKGGDGAHRFNILARSTVLQYLVGSCLSLWLRILYFFYSRR